MATIHYNVEEAEWHFRSGRFDAALCLLRPDNYDTVRSRKVYDIVKQIASKFNHDPPKFHNSKKLKVGYLTEGLDKLQAPVKRLLYLSKHHNKSGLDMTLFNRVTRYDSVTHTEYYGEVEKEFSDNDCKVITVPGWLNGLDRSLWLFDAIREEKIDVLVTYAMVTVPHVHFLCAMKPAFILIKDTLQEPEYSDLPDATIHHSPQTMEGDTGICKLFPFRGPKPEKVKTYTRFECGLPDDAIVLASVGRPGKFTQKGFMEAIEDALNVIPNAWFIGIGSKQPKGERQVHTGIIENPYDVIRDVADIYLDTFPLGGGWTLYESIMAGVPVVMFDKGEAHKTSEKTLPEIWGINDTTVPRWDMEAWKNTIQRLILDDDFRDNIQTKMKARADVLSDYASYVHERESLYAEMCLSKRCTRKFLDGYGRLDITLPIYANNMPETIYIDNSADITIGRGLVISRDVTILTHEHLHDKGLPICDAEAKRFPLVIGDDVQIGARATILPGCNRIGNGAVIGACAVVTKDVPDNQIWAGNPARFIRERV